MRKRDEERKAKKLRVKQALAAQVARVEAGAAAEGGIVGGSTATTTADVEMATPTQEEEEVSQIQADALTEEVEGRKGKKRRKKGRGSKGKESEGDRMGEIGETKEAEEALQATDDLPTSETGFRKSKKAKKKAKGKELHDPKSAKMTDVEKATEEELAREAEEELRLSLDHQTQETSVKKPKRTKKKGKQNEGQDTESDRTIEDDSAEEARKAEEALKAEADRKAQEDAEEAERKRLRRNELSKEYKRKKAAEKRLEAAQQKVQDSLAATMAGLGMSPRREQSLELLEWWTLGNADAEEAAVDLTEYEPGIDEEWMKLLQDSAPDGERLGDENDSDWDDVDSDKEDVIHKSAIGGMFDDDNHVSRPMDKMNDFMTQIYSTFQDAASLLTTTSGPSSGPSTPLKKVRPPRNLQQEAHHFSHSHPFYSDGAWIHTISDRRAYQRDVYDYLRAKGFSRQEVYSGVMAHQLKDDWMNKFGPKEYDDESDGSAFGNREIDDSEMILMKLRDSIKSNMTPSSKRRWDQVESSDARNSGSDENDVDGTPSTRKRRKSVTFAKDVKIDDGGSMLIARSLQVNTPDLTDEKQSALPNLNDMVEDLMEKDIEGNSTEDRDAERKRRRETRKKIQKDFKKLKAASWVSEQCSVEPDNVDIADTSMNEDIPGPNPVVVRRSMEALKYGIADTSMNKELPASSWFAGHRSLEVKKSDIADTSINEPLSFHQTTSRDYHTTIREDSIMSSDTSEELNEREEHEELIRPATNLSSPSRLQCELVSRIDILSGALKAKASQFKEETANELPKEKKRKRNSKSTDDKSVTLITDPDDVKEKTVDVEDTENADRKKKWKKRKSKSTNDNTVDFLTPMIHEA
jgi:hypothetical protein